MKKVLLSIGVLAAAYSASYSQDLPAYQRFNFSDDAQTYTPLSSAATVVNFGLPEGEVWDDEISASIPLPIDFTYQNVPITSISIDTYGGLILNDMETDEGMPQIMGLYMDYMGAADRGQILYETTGTTGSRIFKVEFRDVSSYENYTGNDTFNFQIWLHEGSNVIETHTGYTNVPREYFFQSVVEMMMTEEAKEVLMTSIMTNEGDVLEMDINNLYLHHVTDDVAAGTYGDRLIVSSELVDMSDLEAIDPLIIWGYPTEGKVFRFTPLSTTSLQTIDPTMVSIFPNPAQGQLTVQLAATPQQDSQYIIYDVYGRQMMTDAVNASHMNLDISSLPAGQYFLQINHDHQVGTYKFTKL